MHIHNGQTVKEALLCPSTGKTNPRVDQKMGKVPLSTHFRSLQAHQSSSPPISVMEDEVLLESCGEKNAAEEEKLYTQLLEIRKATPYIDQVGLCETHKQDRFENLHFGSTALA